MHGVEEIRQVPQHAPAKRLDIRVPALAIGGERNQQVLRMLPELLLQFLVLEVAGADCAAQVLFSKRICREILTQEGGIAQVGRSEPQAPNALRSRRARNALPTAAAYLSIAVRSVNEVVSILVIADPEK